MTDSGPVRDLVESAIAAAAGAKAVTDYRAKWGAYAEGGIRVVGALALSLDRFASAIDPSHNQENP